MTDARWAEHRVARDNEQAMLRACEAAGVGSLSDREVVLLGAAIYWCEGTKAKPWRTNSWQVQFVNSDAGLIRLFLRFVEQLGYPRESLRYRVSIHESADVEGAQRWWEEQAGLPVGSLTAVTLKRHDPSPGRHRPQTSLRVGGHRAGAAIGGEATRHRRRAAYNIRDDYHGCLVIVVPRASALYWRIEGIMMGLVADCSCDPVQG